ncbi:hypothetical protein [Candidatus Caldatribacterium sp.]|uniref:hypothetical protein n=1 Tax=Candidatus Caldatribacterium sp. TaxID=2282143 RepID=UPI00299386CA|nr:hypothetical protein [Candidatus Caldatribacterium sp.]MDW8080917.1 hypothetical protein [Candidatus Calescibacterium sp.]
MRCKVNGYNKFYAQLICEVMPYQKPKNALGRGVIGIDAGSSIIARVGRKKMHLDRLCKELTEEEAEKHRLQRKLNRSHRTNRERAEATEEGQGVPQDPGPSCRNMAQIERPPQEPHRQDG